MKLAVIENSWDNKPTNENRLDSIKTYATANGIELLGLNAFNDQNLESAKIKKYYP